MLPASRFSSVSMIDVLLPVGGKSVVFWANSSISWAWGQYIALIKPPRLASNALISSSCGLTSLGASGYIPFSSLA